MIYAELLFEPGQETLKAVAAALLALPDDLRPTRRSESESSAGKPIGDIGKFLESLGSGPARSSSEGASTMTSLRRTAARSHAGAN